MEASRKRSIRKYFQVSLRFLFVIVTVACIVAYIDPWGWKPPPRIPIRPVMIGETAQVDVIEMSHFHASNVGRNVRQVIFWSYYPDGKLHVRSWLFPESSNKSGFSIRPISRGWHECSWTQNGIPWRVQAPTYRETQGHADPELEDRESLARIRRADLWAWPQPAMPAQGKGNLVGTDRR